MGVVVREWGGRREMRLMWTFLVWKKKKVHKCLSWSHKYINPHLINISIYTTPPPFLQPHTNIKTSSVFHTSRTPYKYVINYSASGEHDIKYLLPRFMKDWKKNPQILLHLRLHTEPSMMENIRKITKQTRNGNDWKTFWTIQTLLKLIILCHFYFVHFVICSSFVSCHF